MTSPTIETLLARIVEVEKERDAAQQNSLTNTMLAYKWMRAHDALKEGRPYDYPKPADVPNVVTQLTAAQQRVGELTAMEHRKDAAYLERNQVVAALAKCFPSGTKRTAIEGWSGDWHGCVYIDLPTGQASWHYHDSQAYLFTDLPPYQGEWDGHTTEQKYERIERLSAPLGDDAVERVAWKPIESAPKDGTTILCWDKYAAEPYTAHWYLASGRFVPVWDDGAVIEYQNDFGTEYKTCSPTHWCPLPRAATADISKG